MANAQDLYVYIYIDIYTDKPFQETWPFLREAVRRRDYDLDQSIASKAEQQRLQKFLSQAYASDALTWQKVFGSHPPRQTLARLCRRFRVQVHVTEGQHNVRNAKEFTTEVHRISRWYRERRRADVSRRRKVLRERQKAVIKGSGTVMNKKVRAHLRRLRRPLRVESMMMWKEAALQTLAAGIPVQSGTVCVERFWAVLLTFLPQQVRQMSQSWWEVLAQLSFVKFNYQHFSSHALSSLAERDAEIQSKLSTCMLLAKALHDSEVCQSMGLNDLFDPFRGSD